MSVDVSLNLYTFELPENQHCQYVLTSPRSLKACRELNLRPIDLLPKTEVEIAEERPNLTSEERTSVTKKYEENRLRNLQTARAIRDSLVKTTRQERMRDCQQHSTCRQYPSLENISEVEKDPKWRDAEDMSIDPLYGEQLDGYEVNVDKQAKQEKNSILHMSLEEAKNDFEEKYERETSEKETRHRDETSKLLKSKLETSQKVKKSIASTGERKPKIRSYTFRPSSGYKKKLTSFSTLDRKDKKSFTNMQRSSSSLREAASTIDKASYGHKESSISLGVTSNSGQSSTASKISSISFGAFGQSQDVSPYLCSEGVRYKPSRPFIRNQTQNTAGKLKDTKGSSSISICSTQKTSTQSGNFHWISATPQKTFMKRDCGMAKSGALQRPNSANRNKRKVISDRKTTLYSSTSTLTTPRKGCRAHDARKPYKRKQTASEYGSHISLIITNNKSSSENDSSHDAASSGISHESRSVRKKKGEPCLRRSRGTRRRPRRKYTSSNRVIRSFPMNLNRGSSHVWSSADKLGMDSSRENFLSTNSLPAQMTLNVTSNSSLSSISSLNSNVTSFSNSARNSKKSLNKKLRSSIPIPEMDFPTRPASSLGVPSHHVDREHEFPRKTTINVRRSQSAKLPRSQRDVSSPLSLPLSLRKTTSTVSLADSQILSKFLDSMNLNVEVSKEDRRILELLALKHEKRYQSEISAFKSHQQWKREKEKEIKEKSSQWQEWQNHVNEKRRRENEENERRWKEIEESFNESIEKLSKSLETKERRSQQLLQARCRSRLLYLQEKKSREREKRSMVEAALQAREEKQEQQRVRLLQLWEKQQKLVEKRKAEREMIQKKKLGELSSAARERHLARQEQVQAEGEALLEAMRNYMEERLKRTELNYFAVQQTKNECLRRNKEKREKKSAEVRALHDRLEADLSVWRQHILHQQLESAREAEYRLLQNLKAKTTSVHENLSQRKDQHRRLYQQIQERERSAEETARQILAMKDWRSRRIAAEKEAHIIKAKTAAVTTASLRDHLKKRFSPETFDRKVLRARIEHRMENLHQAHCLDASRSHIFLG